MLSSLASVRPTAWRRERRGDPAFDLGRGECSRRPRPDRLAASEGAHVFITGRRKAELDAAVKALGPRVTGVQGDVAVLADLDRLYVVVKEPQGRVDVLFANAGGGKLVPLGEITEARPPAYGGDCSPNGGESAFWP